MTDTRVHPVELWFLRFAEFVTLMFVFAGIAWLLGAIPW